MDNRIRKNEICSIGLPRCDFVFSSTRSCFIAYGFEESKLEMTIIRNILEKYGIQSIDAGGHTAPGQSAFCSKICSKIITSQFCIVLLNDDNKEGEEIPNANVNMEYGLMLGFNKYIIPFQRDSQSLPFNVAGLDTIKYTNNNLEEKAEKIILQAIEATQQEESPPLTSNQIISSFLLSRNLLVSPIDSDGERILYRLGEPVGFSMLVDFAGLDYTYFGNFSSLRDEVVEWRILKLVEILEGRKSSQKQRSVLLGSSPEQIVGATYFFNSTKIIVLVTSKLNKTVIENKLKEFSSPYPIEIITMDEVEKHILNIE